VEGPRFGHRKIPETGGPGRCGRAGNRQFIRSPYRSPLFRANAFSISKLQPIIVSPGSGTATATRVGKRNQQREFGNVLAKKSLYFDLGTLNYNFQYHFAERSGWKTTVGVNGMRQENQNKGAEVRFRYTMFDIGHLFTPKGG
jgi:hypothetical protein